MEHPRIRRGHQLFHAGPSWTEQCNLISWRVYVGFRLAIGNPGRNIVLKRKFHVDDTFSSLFNTAASCHVSLFESKMLQYCNSYSRYNSASEKRVKRKVRKWKLWAATGGRISPNTKQCSSFHAQVLMTGCACCAPAGVSLAANQEDETDMETFQMEIDKETRKCTFRTSQGNCWALVAHGGIQSTATEEWVKVE